MNRFVLAEPNKCIGCRTCEIACVVAHQASGEEITALNFTPRLTVIKKGAVTTPVLCRQCDDAACVKACSNNAIIFGEDSIQILSERCMGCRSCVVACPYGAMSMVTVQAEPQPGHFTTHRKRSEAHKCDLCIDRTDGPACIPVCPTKALTLMDKDTVAAMLHKRKEQATR